MSINSPALLTVAQEISKTLKLDNVAFAAQGAFKETYKAVAGNGVVIALKVLDPAKCNIARTKREVEAMQRCDSPHIGKLYGYDKILAHDGNEYHYVVEDFLDGGTLTDRLTAKLSPDTVRHYAANLVQALTHLSSLNLVHRDIKPDNIMFRCSSNDPILVDFGLVRDLSASSLTQTWLSQGPGTPYFSAPEQLRNEKSLIDWRTDQFSLGVVLGMCLTNNHPFAVSGMSMTDTVIALSQRQRCSTQFRDEALDLGFGNIVKMIEPWSVRRFQTPEELLQSF